jgi:haloalkane dehalogenase
LIKPLFYFLRRPPVVKKWAGIAYYNSEAITPELVEILANPAQDVGAASTFVALFQSMSKASFAPKVRGILPHLDMPLLLIWGRHDRMVPPGLIDRFTAMNPALEVVALEAGHCPHDECPEIVNPILCQWLSRHAETAPNYLCQPVNK